MTNKITKFFKPDQTLVLRSIQGERRLHFSQFHQFVLAGLLATTIFAILYLLSSSIMSSFSPVDEATLSKSLRDDYEARISALVAERDSLSNALSESQANAERLVANLGEQQNLLFSLERTNYELENNLNSLRTNLVSSQNRLDALDLQIETQNKQLTAIENGESGGADSATLSTITATLAETAMARDEARAEVQALREKIATNEQEQQEAQHRRQILFDQIESAIQTSLVPMKSTLSKTGLNIDSLLNNIRKNAQIGGITASANFAEIAGSPELGKQMENIVDDLDELANMSYLAQSLPLGQPVQSGFRMTSSFGYRRHPISHRTAMHTGQDMAASIGTPIYATGNGRIVEAGWVQGYGKTVKIQHPNGIQTLYGHLSRIRVSMGQSVKLGERIGDMGSTGNSTGSHLHYEVIINGTPVNPTNFLRASNYVQ